MNRQSALPKNCLTLRNEVGINLAANRPEYTENGPISAFAACKSLARLLEPDKLNPDIKLKPLKLQPAPVSEQQKAVPAYTINNRC